MKTSAVKTLIVAAGLVGSCAATLVLAEPASAPKGTFETLSSISTLELPQAAAKIVSQAPKADQPVVARQVLEKIAALSKPGLTPVVVSSVCRAVPTIAADVVTAAIAVQPGETLSIVRAGLHAAPNAGEAIVAAVCRQTPEAYAWTAIIASEEAPAARPQIIKAIATSIPELATPLAKAQTYTEGRSMAELIHKTHELALSDYQDKVSQPKRANDSSANEVRAQITSSSTTPVVAEMAYLQQSVQPRSISLNTDGTPLSSVQGPPRVGLPFTPLPPSWTEPTYGGFTVPPNQTRNYSAP